MLSIVFDIMALFGAFGAIVYFAREYMKHSSIQEAARLEVEKQEQEKIAWESRTKSPTPFSISTWIPGREVE
jgi:hypothetical protein